MNENETGMTFSLSHFPPLGVTFSLSIDRDKRLWGTASNPFKSDFQTVANSGCRFRFKDILDSSETAGSIQEATNFRLHIYENVNLDKNTPSELK